MRKVNSVLNYYLKQNNGQKDYAMSNAASNIKKLLSELDLNSELIPENNLNMLNRLLTSLKGSPLEKEEKKIVQEIINYKLV